jgi:pimeloyl-ACP methyl ester carboxylesterase
VLRGDWRDSNAGRRLSNGGMLGRRRRGYNLIDPMPRIPLGRKGPHGDTMPFLSLPFHRLRYEDTGGTKPVLILSHSFGMRAEMFAPQLEAFAATYRCITWDQRAHGESPAGHPFTFWDSAKDLLALMDHLSIPRAHLAGTSQGGFVALRTALLAPSRVESLSVFGSSADVESEATKVAYQSLLSGVQASSFYEPANGVIEAMVSVCFGTDFDSTVWKRSWAVWNPAQFEMAFNALAGRDAIVDSLRTLAVPTLVLHGTHDAAYPVETGGRIADAIQGSVLKVVDGGHHFLSITDSAAVNEAMQRFLEKPPSVSNKRCC